MIIKSYIQFIKESSGYEYGCVMVEVPVSNWDEITTSINPEDVYTGGDDSHGIQEFSHLTLLYGLKKEVTEKKIRSIIDNFHGVIKIEIDGINLFENEKFDVLKFNVVEDDGIQQLHDELSKLPNNDKYPVYKPHITIAYLNKGMGNKYVNPDYKYSVKNINKISYSSPGKEKIEIPINRYESESHNIPVFEKRGIPNIIKHLYKLITNDIISHIEDGDELNNYNLLGNNISIGLKDVNISDIRGRSQLNKIELSFNFKDIDKLKLSRVVLHELIHVYEINKRTKNNSKFKLQWDINEILRREESKWLDDSLISDLCYLIYQSFDHEINARVADVYSFLIGLNTTNKNTLLLSLENTKSWHYKNLLENWNPDWNKVNWVNLIEFLTDFNLEILIKYKDQLNFNIYKIPTSEKECKNILKSWIYIFRKKSKYFEEKLLKIVDEVIDDTTLSKTSIIERDNNSWIIKYDKLVERDIKINKILRD